MKINPSKSTGHINKNNNNNSNKNNVAIDIKNIPKNKEFSLPLSPSVSSPLIPWDEKKGDTPSHIWMNRTKALPKLGGSKICPGCNLSISVMDDTPGPKASRWHKKCLKCTGCKKQMDSGAKVIELDNKWLVKCSDCSVSNLFIIIIIMILYFIFNIADASLAIFSCMYIFILTNNVPSFSYIFN